MNIINANKPTQAHLRPTSSSASTKSEVGELPAWVDRYVPSAPSRVKTTLLGGGIGTAVGAAVGTGGGAAVAAILGKSLPQGGLIGAGAGLAAGLATGLGAGLYRSQKALRAHHDSRVSMARNQAQAKANFQASFDLPDQPTQEFGRARTYQKDNNLLVEFPATGSLLMVENLGLKKPMFWVPEGQAYGAPRDASPFLANAAIPETRITRISGGSKVGREFGYDYYGNDISAPTPKETQVTLEDGVLKFSHSGAPKKVAAYNLETGAIDTPHFSSEGGLITRLEIPRSKERGPSPGMTYDQRGYFADIDSKGSWPSFIPSPNLTPVLSPEIFGDSVRFPEVVGDNQARTEILVEQKNNGQFQHALHRKSYRTDDIPDGAWVEKPIERLLKTEIEVQFAGGTSFQAVKDSNGNLEINGVPSPGWTVDLDSECLLMKEPLSKFGEPSDKYGVQKVFSDGTIQWTYSSRQLFVYGAETYTFKPDGSVEGYRTDENYGGERSLRPISPEELPRLLPDGTLLEKDDYRGGERVRGKVFLSPQQIGWGSAG